MSLLSTNSWLLLALLAVPLATTGLLLLRSLVPTAQAAWNVGFAGSIITLGIVLAAFGLYDWQQNGVQLASEVAWMPQLGLTFSLGIDSLSLWMMLVTALVMPITALASKPPTGDDTQATDDRRSFFIWIHVLLFSMLGALVARDVILFYAFFELTLLPSYILIGRFGHLEKGRAATTMFVYGFVSALFTFAGLAYIATHHAQLTGFWSFQIDDLISTAPMMTPTEQGWVFLALMLGFAVKTPLFPLHNWLPTAHQSSSADGAVDLAALVLKLGPYGILRIVLPMLPVAVVEYAPLVATLAVIGIIYAGLIAWVQPDAKGLIAYSSISHMGFVILGIFALDDQNIGPVGAAAYLVNHGIAAGGLLLCVGILHDRFKTRELGEVSGLAKVMPAWTFFFVFFVMASVGLPGLNGFVGEFLTLMGTFLSANLLGPIFALFAGLGLIIGALYLLRLANTFAFGPLKATHYPNSGAVDDPEQAKDLSTRELSALAPLAAFCLIFGIFPFPMLSTLEPSVAEMTSRAQAQLYQQVAEENLNQDQPAEAIQTLAERPTTE
ncbi:complex I subunit 4 family protein [Mucisphaera sp.]|uniref:complex I subunit 4 family protein n=1 Tax=Mucisphaera sp. TaxID=2913024 RepID=UPI003D12FB34